MSVDLGCGGRVPVALGDALEPGAHLCVGDEIQAERTGCGGSCDVVVGRTESAGGDHERVGVAQSRKCACERLDVVCHRDRLDDPCIRVC